MGQILLPKHLQPGWSRPGVKPTELLELDPKHPLVRHLRAFIVFNEGGGGARDLVTGKLLATTGSPTWSAGRHGRTQNFNGTSQSSSFALDLSNANTLTVAGGWDWPSYANNDDLALEFTSNYSTATASGGILIDPNSGAPSAGKFQIGRGPNTDIAAADFARPSNGYHDYLFSFRPEVSGLAAWVDGKSQSLTYTANNEKTANYADSILYLASRNNANLFARMDYSYLAIWDEDVSDLAVSNSFSLDPYQILKPAVQQSYFFTTAGGGGGTTGTASHQAATATQSATGLREITGTSAHQATTATQSAAGTVGAAITGTATHQATSATQSAAGQREVTGTASHQTSTATHTATGSREISGQAAHQAATTTHLASGAVGNVITGTASHAANDATHSSAGLRIVGGTATHTAQTAAHTASGAAAGAITGAASHQAQRATASALGVRVIAGIAAHQAATATQAATTSPGFSLPLGTTSVADTTPVYSVIATDPDYTTLDTSPLYSVSASG